MFNNYPRRRFRPYTPYVRRARAQYERHNIVDQTGAITQGNQTSVTLYTAGKPVKIAKMRLQAGIINFNATLATQGVFYAIVKVENGNTVNALTVSAAAELYTPTENVLATGTISGMSWVDVWIPISMKLKQGDTIVAVFANTAIAANTTNIQYMWSYTQIE